MALFSAANLYLGENICRLINCATMIINTAKKIILSTPFGTHYKEYRERYGKIYWEFSNSLFSEGFSIYYTDINKIWIKEINASKKLKIPKDLM